MGAQNAAGPALSRAHHDKNPRPAAKAESACESFSFLDRNVMIKGRAGVNLARPVDSGLAVLHDLLVIGDPAGHAADGEHNSEHLQGNADGAHDNAAVKIDIGIEFAFDKVGIL